MANKVSVNLYEIASVSPKVKSFRMNRLANIRNNVDAIRRSLSGDILSSYDINNRILNACGRISQLEKYMSGVEAVLDMAYDQYSKVESDLYKESEELEMNNFQSKKEPSENDRLFK